MEGKVLGVAGEGFTVDGVEYQHLPPNHYNMVADGCAFYKHRIDHSHGVVVITGKVGTPLAPIYEMLLEDLLPV